MEARKVVETLRDPKEFFLNFSLPTVARLQNLCDTTS